MAFIDCTQQTTARKSAWPERPHCEHGEWISSGTIWKSRKAAKKYKARSYKRVRAKAVEYLGGVCANCGTPGNDAMGPLEFDHIDPDTKTFNIADRLSRGWLPKLLTELHKCQLLHRECHKAKTAQEATQRATAKQDQLDALINTYQGSEAA